MNTRSVYAYAFLVSLCSLIVSCDSAAIQPNPEISVEFLEYIGPVDSNGYPIASDSLFHNDYCQTVEIIYSSQSVEKVVDLSAFPYKTIPLDGSGFSSGPFEVDIPEEMFGSVYLFFDKLGSPFPTSSMVAVGPKVEFPQIPSLRLKESVEMRVYGFVLERAEQDYPETLEIKWYFDDVPYSLVIRPYEHFVPEESIVRLKTSGYSSQFERGGLISKFGSKYSDPSIFPVLRLDNFRFWQDGEVFAPLSFEWFIGGYSSDLSEGAEYGRFFSHHHQLGPESEMLYYLLRRPPYSGDEEE